MLDLLAIHHSCAFSNISISFWYISFSPWRGSFSAWHYNTLAGELVPELIIMLLIQLSCVNWWHAVCHEQHNIWHNRVWGGKGVLLFWVFKRHKCISIFNWEKLWNKIVPWCSATGFYFPTGVILLENCLSSFLLCFVPKTDIRSVCHNIIFIEQPLARWPVRMLSSLIRALRLCFSFSQKVNVMEWRQVVHFLESLIYYAVSFNRW